MEMPQLRGASARLPEKRDICGGGGEGPDLISKLPDECTGRIFSFLDSPRDRCSCACVSRKWLLLLAVMRPADFRCRPCLRPGAPPPAGNDGNADRGRSEQRERAKSARFQNFQGAHDAGLAAMAVGICAAEGTLTDLTVRSGFFCPAPASPSSLLNVTDRGLKIISRAFHDLRHVSFLDCAGVGDQGLAAMADGCPSLERLYIAGASRLSDAGLVPVAQRCTKLLSLTLHSCPLVGDGALHALARHSSGLECLSLDSCRRMTDAGLADVLSSAPRLAKFTIRFMNMGDAALGAVAARGEGRPVLAIFMENVSGFTGAGFRRLVQAAKLDALSVRRCAAADDGAFSGVGGGSGAASLEGATALPVGLRRVALRDCEGFTDAGLIALSEFARHVAKLRLEKCHRVTTRGVAVAVGNWSSTLKLLSLVRCNGIGGRRQPREAAAEEEEEEGDIRFTRCPHLQTLAIKHCPGVRDEFLARLGGALGRAKRVELVGMRAVGDRGFVSLLAHMERRDGLRLVELSGCKRITDWSVMALVSASGEALSRLTLRGCVRVTDRCLPSVGLLCTALEELDLTGCRQIGDAGVAGLLARGAAPGVQGGGLRKMDMLSLEGCEGVTDESLRSVGEMVMQGALEWVNLRGCAGVSRGGIYALQQAFPWCEFLQ